MTDVNYNFPTNISPEPLVAVHNVDSEPGKVDDLHEAPVGNLQRRLKSRHIQFLALSGAIGTGLFVGSGQALTLAGPLSAVLAYAITGFNLYCVINSLGEMATYLPMPGAIPHFGSRFVDPALGFALSWNYWYQLAIGVPNETTAAAIVIDYWPNTVPIAAWITILLGAMVLVNCAPVNFYGEAEFVFGSIKILTILALLILMLVIDLGGAPSHDRVGFRYWVNPGPMNEYLVSGSLGRFLAFFKVFVNATFAYGGSELCVVAAGETENPRVNIPKAVRRVFWRVAIFYVLAILLIGMCVSSADPRLLDAIKSGASGVAASPFVIAIVNGGIPVLPSIINAVVLTSAWSSGNAFFYSSTRIMYAAALDGKAPRVLSYEKWGVPYACVAVTALLGLIAYLNVGNASSQVFFWLSNISSVTTLITWGCICLIYLRFYYGLRRNEIERSTLPWASPFQPYLAYFGLSFCSIVAFFNGFDCFFPGRFTAKSFVPAYIGIPIFMALFVAYKVIYKTKAVPLSEMDFWSGKAEIDAQEGMYIEQRKPRNWLEKIWLWIA